MKKKNSRLTTCELLHFIQLASTNTNYLPTNERTQQPPKSIQEVENEKQYSKRKSPKYILKSVIPHVTITVIFRQLNGSLVSQILVVHSEEG